MKFLNILAYRFGDFAANGFSRSCQISYPGCRNIWGSHIYKVDALFACLFGTDQFPNLNVSDSPEISNSGSSPLRQNLSGIRRFRTGARGEDEIMGCQQLFALSPRLHLEQGVFSGNEVEDATLGRIAALELVHGIDRERASLRCKFYQRRDKGTYSGQGQAHHCVSMCELNRIFNKLVRRYCGNDKMYLG